MQSLMLSLGVVAMAEPVVKAAWITAVAAIVAAVVGAVMLRTTTPPQRDDRSSAEPRTTTAGSSDVPASTAAVGASASPDRDRQPPRQLPPVIHAEQPAQDRTASVFCAHAAKTLDFVSEEFPENRFVATFDQATCIQVTPPIGKPVHVFAPGFGAKDSRGVLVHLSNTVRRFDAPFVIEGTGSLEIELVDERRPQLEEGAEYKRIWKPRQVRTR